MAGLVLRDNLVADRLQPGVSEERPVGVGPQRGEEHRGTEPVLVDVLAWLAHSERREEMASAPEPEADSHDQLALFLDGNVPEEEEREGLDITSHGETAYSK